MFCISCGAKLPDDARFCAVCGAKAYRPDPEEGRPLEDASENSAEPDDASPEGGEAAGEEPASVEAAAESDALESAAEAADEVSLRSKVHMKVKNPAFREGSGSLDLPEIDPSQPFPPAPERDGHEDDISVSPDVTVVLPPGPFKPSYGPLSASDLFEADGTTAKMPRIESADGEVLMDGDSPVKNFVQSNTVPKRWTPLRVFVLVAMVAVAIALAIAAIQLYGQREASAPSSSASSSTSSVSVSSSSSAQSSSSASSSSSARGEEARLAGLYGHLDEAYDQIGTLNDRMGDAVDDYNTYYAAADQAARQQASDRCNALSSDIASAATELSAYMDENDCTEGSAYYDQFQDQLSLLDLLSQRVAPLVSSWERSVASSNPAADESYILEPLTQVDSSSLVSEFDALYARSAPVEE